MKILFIEGPVQVKLMNEKTDWSIVAINSYFSGFTNSSLTFYDAFNVFISYCLDKMSHADWQPLPDWKWTSKQAIVLINFDWINMIHSNRELRSKQINPLMEQQQKKMREYCECICSGSNIQPSAYSTHSVRNLKEIHLSKRSRSEEMKLCGSEQVLLNIKLHKCDERELCSKHWIFLAYFNINCYKRFELKINILRLLCLGTVR